MRKGYSISPEQFSAVLARLIIGCHLQTLDSLPLSSGFQTEEVTRKQQAERQSYVALQIARELRLVDPLHLVGGIPERTLVRFEEFGSHDGLREVTEE